MMIMVQSFAQLLAALLEPSLAAIITSVLVALTLPILLHVYIYRSSKKSNLPSFLLVGPRGAGKTTLLTHFERGTAAETRTSQTPLTAEVSLPVSTTAASSRFRSVNDPSLQVHKRFLLVDTPGHGKLRHYALDHITKPHNVKGIIFVVDSANLSSEDGLREASGYLHDLLLVLQKRAVESRKSNAHPEVHVLIAANKLDLFTALPAAIVKSTLEQEITKTRGSRSKGLLDSGIGMGDGEGAEERDYLGDVGKDKFQFDQLDNANIQVAVAGGSLVPSSDADVKQWWNWIGQRL
ncbi:MAG: hypothetical protein M1814_006749 [Vezdaea aestivalis]|nr:MAG: hypothetical protein M1814_006749 [Vezdaea aestivalis]